MFNKYDEVVYLNEMTGNPKNPGKIVQLNKIHRSKIYGNYFDLHRISQ